MNTWPPFCAAAAALPGREHARVDRGSQDASAVLLDDDLLLAAVADGCSAAPGSGLGAQLAARFLVVEAARRLRACVPLDELPGVLVERLVRQIRRWARPLARDGRAALDVVADAFLFTCHVAVATPREVLAFGVGDGLVSLNGAPRALPAPRDARPEYPAYRLFPAERLEGGARPAAPVVHLRVPAEQVRSLVLATDGVVPLLEHVPALEAEPRLEGNPGLLQKRLRALAARGAALPDDATLVIVRRRTPCA